MTADQTESTTAEQMIRIWCGHKNGMNPCARGGCFCCACVDFAEDVRQRELDLAQFDLEDKAGKPPGFEDMMRSWWDMRANVDSLRFHARCTPDEPNPSLEDVVRIKLRHKNQNSARLELARRSLSFEAAALAELRNEHEHPKPGYNPPVYREDFRLKVKFYNEVKCKLEVRIAQGRGPWEGGPPCKIVFMPRPF